MRLLRFIFALSLIALAIGTKAVFGAGLNPVLDPVKVAEIQHLSVLLDALPQTYPITLANSDQYTAQWEVEILPWYAYEGIADPVIPPVSIQYFFGMFGPADYINGYVFHILGLSQCEVAGVAQNPFDGNPSPVAGPIFLNGRYINPASPWYQELSWLPTLVHELGHSQGICEGPSPYVESSTQLAMLEVMSAMVNSGNDKVIPGLLYEWNSIIEGALYYEALRDGTLDQYDALLGAVSHYSAKVAARHAASRRFWNATPERQAELKGILYKYEWVVYIKAKYGLKQGYLTGTLPGNSTPRLTSAKTMVPSGNNLVLDDFAYFLAHL